MADAPVFTSETQPTLQQLIDYLVDSLHDEKRVRQWQTAVTNAVAEGTTVSHGAITGAIASVSKDASKALETAEDYARGATAWLIGHMVAHLLGVDVPPDALRGAFKGGHDSVVGKAVGKIVLEGIAGDTAELAPGDAGATRLIGMISNLELNSWFEGILVELFQTKGGFFPPINAIAELGHDLTDALGLGRLARVALRPLVQTIIATPLEWQAHKRHRPTLLSAPSVIRQFNRGAWEWPDVDEELQRHGYSDARISALLNESRKFESVGDVYLLHQTGAWKGDEGLKYLREQGYDQDAALLALRVEGQRRFRALETAEADALVSAYADRRITKEQFDAALKNHVPVETERNLFTELADLRLAVNVRHLSAAQARECVKGGILSVLDYRRALEREGYTADAVTALELLLRRELDEKHTVDEHKRQLAAEHAAAVAEKATAAAAKKAEIDAARALHQQGPISVLEDAYIRGLMPLARLEAVLAPQFAADTVRVYLADVEAKRQAYVATQQRAADAAKRAANRGLSVGQLEQALIDGILTIDEIRPQLADRGLSDSDVAVLLHLMQDAAAAKRRADQLRADAARRAATHTLSLAQAEALVKGGHWTVAQFTTFLATLGYDAADRAAIDSLVQDAIAKAAAAAAIQKAAAAGNAEKGLTLAQLKRGVELGTVSIEAFQAYLVSQRFSAAAVATLVADAQDAAATTRAARARRDATVPASDGRSVPLSTLTRAAQLGILSPAAYLAALQARGFSEEDAALELDLLAAEIAAAHTPAPAPGTAEATLGASDQTLPATAAARHVQVDGELAARGLTLATVEKSVKAGDTTIDAYTNWLEANGYGHGDAEILTALLAASLEAAAAAGP